MTLSIMTLSIMALSIMTLSITISNVTQYNSTKIKLKALLNDSQHNGMHSSTITLSIMTCTQHDDIQRSDTRHS
jgi:hypothetical protein